MSALSFVVLSIAGGVGAAARFTGDALLRQLWRTHLPVATVCINLVGSLLIGVLAARAAPGTSWFAVLGTGLLGGFTTFSTASVETVRLAQSGRSGWALGSLLLVPAAAVGLAALGLWLGSR